MLIPDSGEGSEGIVDTHRLGIPDFDPDSDPDPE